MMQSAVSRSRQAVPARMASPRRCSSSRCVAAKKRQKSPLHWTRDLLKEQMLNAAPLGERGGREGCGLVRRVARFGACQKGGHSKS